MKKKLNFEAGVGSGHKIICLNKKGYKIELDALF